MPLAAASVLKSASHASNVPVPQATAACDVAGAIRAAPTARAAIIKRGGSTARTGNRFAVEGGLSAENLRGNRGQNMACTAVRMNAHRRPVCGRRSDHTTILAASGAVLAPPGEQGCGEIRRETPFKLRPGRDRPRVRIRRDHLAIEMPGG